MKGKPSFTQFILDPKNKLVKNKNPNADAPLESQERSQMLLSVTDDDDDGNKNTKQLKKQHLKPHTDTHTLTHTERTFKKKTIFNIFSCCCCCFSESFESSFLQALSSRR